MSINAKYLLPSSLLFVAATFSSAAQAELGEGRNPSCIYEPVAYHLSTNQVSTVSLHSESFEEEFASFFSNLLNEQQPLPEEAAAILDREFWDLC
ncbi:hypothetical protein [Turicimonas muris]|uniref:hypothetical protein n=1 Tax=Turicimonas muris TaxID=1796652 RepID=UPI0023F49D03|nr:hypothetical protein [Turicimonas muris]